MVRRKHTKNKSVSIETELTLNLLEEENSVVVWYQRYGRAPLPLPYWMPICILKEAEEPR